MRKRELVALSSRCLVTVIILWLFSVPWVGLQYVIVVSPDHTQLLFSGTETNHDLEIQSFVPLMYKELSHEAD